VYHTCVTYIALVGAPILATWQPIGSLLGVNVCIYRRNLLRKHWSPLWSHMGV